MESTYNKQKTKKVYKNMSTDSFEMEEFLPVSPIIPMYELFKSKYPSISDNYTFHIPLDENSNNPTEELCNKEQDDSCNILHEKSKCTLLKKIDCTQSTARKRKNVEDHGSNSNKKSNNIDKNETNETKETSDADVKFAKPKVNLPLIVKDRTYGRLINTQKYFTKNQLLRPKFSKIIQSGSKSQLPLKELRDMFCIFSQFKELDEFCTFAQYFLK